MLETIFTVSDDFIASVIRDVLLKVSERCPDPKASIPSWIQVRVGTDDLPDAYRGHPVRHERTAWRRCTSSMSAFVTALDSSVMLSLTTPSASSPSF